MSLLPDVIDRYRRDREFEIAEVSERQRERLLNVWGPEGAKAADLVQSASQISGATQSIAVAVSGMAAVADWAMPAIVEHLALAAERLGGVEQMLANPTETAAAEFYRRGTYALSCGWWEEAVADLSEAVQRYPYNPRTWFNLGVAQQWYESADAAAEAFGRCARYGVSLEPALAAGAVLLAASLHRAAGRTDASADILRSYAEKIDRCAELHLVLGVHHHDLDHLVKALLLVPDLAVDARVAKAPRVDEAARTACEMAEGPVRRLRAVEQLIVRVADSARDAGIKNMPSQPTSLSLPSSGVDALLLASAALPHAANVIADLTSGIRDECQRLQASAESAARRRDDAAGQAQYAARTAEQVALDVSALSIWPAWEDAWRKEWGKAWQQELTQKGRKSWLDAWNAASGNVRPQESYKISAQKAGNWDEMAHKSWIEAWSEAWDSTWVAWGNTWKKSTWYLQVTYDRIAVRQAGEQIWIQARDRNGTGETSKWAWQQIRDQAWGQTKLQLRQQLRQLAVGTPNRTEADQYIDVSPESFETEGQESDERLEALQRNLSTLLVASARQRTQKTRDEFEAMIGPAEEASRLADRAARVLRIADEACGQGAIQATMPPGRIIPFDLPGEWNDLVR